MNEQILELEQKIRDVIAYCQNDGFYDPRKVAIAKTWFETTLLWLKDADNRKKGD